MNRFSLRKSYWLCLSFLALLMATSGTRADVQIPVDVEASAGSMSPDWFLVSINPPVPASATLAATVTPPDEPYPCTLNGPFWEWGLNTDAVYYSADNSTWSQAPSNGFSAWIVVNPGGATATLNVIFYIGGYWQFPLLGWRSLR